MLERDPVEEGESDPVGEARACSAMESSGLASGDGIVVLRVGLGASTQCFLDEKQQNTDAICEQILVAGAAGISPNSNGSVFPDPDILIP